MFSKSRPNDPTSPTPTLPEPPTLSATNGSSAPVTELRTTPAPSAPPAAPKPKPSPSILSSDITITGNIRSSGDIQIEGTIEGDVRAHTLIVGETATVKGEVVAEDVVVNGRVVGRLRGLKVRLSTSARVEGDIVHKTIAIESGAHFEGSVQRQEDPLSKGSTAPVQRTAQQASTPQNAVVAAE
jgi:cytoskeletal protein CcmA (bactofilin family)